jgi:hypothetical protein
MKAKLKLFVCRESEGLAGWSAGAAVVLAENEDKAWEQLCKDNGSVATQRMKDEGDKLVEVDLCKPQAFVFYGGD